MLRRVQHESEDLVLIQQWLPAIQIVEIVVSVAVIFFILLQVRGAGLGSAFGGSSAGSVFKTRRGVERLIFNITIIFVVLFVFAFLNIRVGMAGSLNAVLIGLMGAGLFRLQGQTGQRR